MTRPNNAAQAADKPKACTEFNAWLKRVENAPLYWNQSDAMLAAFVAGHAEAMSKLRAPVAREPFMYGIIGPDGKAHFEEFCVSGDRDELQAEVVDHLNRDNPEDGTYSVVALFRDAAPQASAEDDRGALAHKVNLLTAESLGHRSAANHLSALVDELRGRLIEARQAMTDIQQALVPAFDTPETLTMVPNDALAPFCAVLERLRELELPQASATDGLDAQR